MSPHKKTLLGAIAVTSVFSAAIITQPNTSAISGSELVPNPDYQQYIQDVEAGNGSRWSLIPTKYKNIFHREGDQALSRAALPTSYDLRDEDCGTVKCSTMLKNQGQEGICWAYAATTAIESNLLKTKGIRTSISAKQMDYLLANPSTALSDGGTNLHYDNMIRTYGVSRELTDGGNIFLARYGLDSGVSAIKEDEFFSKMKTNDVSLQNYSSFKEYALDESLNVVPPYTKAMPTDVVLGKRSDYIIKDINIYADPGIDDSVKDLIISSIKDNIMQNGAMFVSTKFEPSNSLCWDETSKTITDNVSCNPTSGHALSIIGWDDNHQYYDATSGTTKVGAFLAQNSWGEDSDYPPEYAGLANPYIYLAYDGNYGTVTGINADLANGITEIGEGYASGITRDENKIEFKYSINGTGKLEGVSFFNIELGLTPYKVSVSKDGSGSDYQEIGQITSPVLIAGQTYTDIDQDIDLSGDFMIKIEPLTGTFDTNPDDNFLYTINAYLSGDFEPVTPSPTPTPTPTPDPDVPVPNTGDVVVPNTGLFSGDNTIAVAISIASLPVIAILIYLGRNFYRNQTSKVRFGKK